MYNNRRYIAITLIVLCLFFTINSVTSTVQAKGEQQALLPETGMSIRPASDGVMDTHPIIPETTKVLSSSTTRYLTSISTDGKTYTFSRTTPELESISLGDVIASEKADLAPYGFLRRVTSITINDEQIILETVQATLEEAIESAQVSVDQSLRPTDIQHATQLAGVSLIQPQGEVFSYTLTDVVLYDADGNLNTTSDQVKANGLINLDIGYEFDLDIDGFTLETLTFLVDTTETAELIIQSENVTLPSITLERTIAEHTFVPIPVGIPGITIVPQLGISVGVDGSIYANVTTGVMQQLSVDGGVTYDDQGWHPISNFSNNFNYLPPDLSSSQYRFQGYARTTLALLINGVAGPMFNVKPYLELDVDPNADPWWELYSGLEVNVGVVVKIFGFTIVDYETNLVDYRLLLTRHWEYSVYSPFIQN